MQLVPVVMCGGAGVRLWPLSRKNHPKQFVPLFDEDGASDGTTLFRRTMDRVARFDCRRTLIVCNSAHRFFAADSLHPHERANCTIVVEPSQRNTAPAATLAALAAREEFGDALLLLMPSDHAIRDPAALLRAVESATAAARQDHIVIFGVTPERAESDYGYLRVADAPAADGLCRVTEFCEKPDPQTAAEWLARGNCYWNSGIFLLKASLCLDAVARFEPAVREACEGAWAQRYADLDFTCAEADSFAKCPNISLDYAVIERADNVMMTPVDMGWNDLGSWNALGEVFSADPDENRIKGDAVLKDAAGNIVYSDARLVSVLGVEHCIIADTPDALLVAGREHAGDIRELVAGMQAAGRPEADQPRTVFRPWGYYETLHKAGNFQVKRIRVNPGHGLSLQMHQHRSEHWVVVQGQARITKGDEVFTLAENESTYIPARVKHRLENIAPQPVYVVEVQCGDYLEEDDIVRFDDRYGRSGADSECPQGRESGMLGKTPSP